MKKIIILIANITLYWAEIAHLKFSISNRDKSSKATWSTVDIETFEQIQEKRIDEFIDNVSRKDSYARAIRTTIESENNYQEFWSFRNENDFLLTRWFYRVKTSQDVIDEYCKDLAQNRNETFKNAQQWKNQMHRISWKIENDDFHKTKFNCQIKIRNKFTRHTSTINYKNIIDIIRFLLEHEFFKDNLTYASERHYSTIFENDDENERSSVSTESDERSFVSNCSDIVKSNHIRKYEKMHTENWWWKIQKKLFDDATIVSLILVIDKTQISLHHDDVAMWSLYVTIDNLNNQCRRNQTRSNFVLLDEISIVKTDKDDSTRLKFQIYHQTMRLIFKRKWTMSKHNELHILI